VPAELITSAANPLVKRVRALAQRKHRQAHQAAFVEGIQPVRQAAEAGVALDTLLVAPDLLRSSTAQRFVEEQEAAGVAVARLTSSLFRRISDREHPAGLAAVVSVPRPSLSALDPAGPCTIVALHEVGNPGNLGTILRTADATGAAAVVLVGTTADPWDPAAVRASMGAVFSVPTIRVDDAETLYAWARSHDVAVATTAGRAAGRLWQVTFPSRLLLVLGGEGPGLDDDALARGDLQVSIPMVGTAESLNVGVAASVLMYEVWRQRAASRA
jgi:TrmH family RNA methyltransferase